MKRAIRAGAVVILLVVGAFGLTDSADATNGIHMNGHYWDEWAYAPLKAINAYDCVSQNEGIQTAANKWNATGLVSITTRLDTCDTSSNGIVWRVNSETTGCRSYVSNDAFTVQLGVLDPDPQTPGSLSMDRHATIYLGSGCPANGQTTCAGYYSPCDVPTHELGHALGLGDHYTHDTGVSSYRFLRQRYSNGSVQNTTYFVPTNTSCYGSVLFTGSVAAGDWYHFAVSGCDSGGVCSNYWDMKNPYTYWIWLPCGAGCSLSGIPVAWYHAH